MARIRSIKPEFWTSESIGRLSRDSRLLFIALWNLADDSGRIRGSLAYLSGAAFPYDDDARGLIGGWLDQLEREKMIRRYRGPDGNSYIDIPKWREHQKIDKPSPSKIPPFAELSTNPQRALHEASPLEGKGGEQGAGSREGMGCAPAETPFDSSGSISEPTDCDRWRMEATLPWARALISEGAKIGPKNWTAWKRIADAHGLLVLVAACKGSDPEARWPDKIEKSITQSRGQVSIGAAIAHKVTKL